MKASLTVEQRWTRPNSIQIVQSVMNHISSIFNYYGVQNPSELSHNWNSLIWKLNAGLEDIVVADGIKDLLKGHSIGTTALLYGLLELVLNVCGHLDCLALDHSRPSLEQSKPWCGV